MLLLLCKNRLHIYRNFVRAHFDRVTLIELACIGLILLYLTARSPSDIGYRWQMIFAPDFPAHWAWLFWAALPVFYLAAEFLAWVTLRPPGEWQILGTLPCTSRAILHDQLLRHGLKTATMVLLGTLPFLLVHGRALVRCAQAATAMIIMLSAQVLAFQRAHRLRRRFASAGHIGRWATIELTIVAVLVLLARQPWPAPALPFDWRHALAAGTLFCILLSNLQRLCPPFDFLGGLTRARVGRANRSLSPRAVFVLCRFWQWHAVRDALLLWRQRSSILLLTAGATLVSTLVVTAQSQAGNAYIAAAFLQVAYCWMMSNALMWLFAEDAASGSALRVLPITAAQWWRARWAFVFILLALPALLPAMFAAWRFGWSAAFMVFVVVGGVAVPAIFALLLCNSAFGMFPHARYAALVLNLFLLLMLLFWFYTPLGSLLLLGLMLAWVRKAQRHFQYLEI